MNELRASTSREHQELEEEVAIGESLKSEDGYRRLLEAFYGFVQPLEAHLAKYSWHDVGLDFEERRKARLLETDLFSVGVSPADVARSNSLPVLRGLADACGALYVMEGSTLGGQHILRMARQANLPDSATNYFRSYGERVGEMWTSFGARLNAFAQEGDCSAQMIEGARNTFRAFQNWFQECRTLN